jgi:hypothetical protein
MRDLDRLPLDQRVRLVLVQSDNATQGRCLAWLRAVTWTGAFLASLGCWAVLLAGLAWLLG